MILPKNSNLRIFTFPVTKFSNILSDPNWRTISERARVYRIQSFFHFAGGNMIRLIKHSLTNLSEIPISMCHFLEADLGVGCTVNPSMYIIYFVIGKYFFLVMQCVSAEPGTKDPRLDFTLNKKVSNTWCALSFFSASSASEIEQRKWS